MSGGWGMEELPCAVNSVHCFFLFYVSRSLLLSFSTIRMARSVFIYVHNKYKYVNACTKLAMQRQITWPFSLYVSILALLLLLLLPVFYNMSWHKPGTEWGYCLKSQKLSHSQDVSYALQAEFKCAPDIWPDFCPRKKTSRFGLAFATTMTICRQTE